MKILSIKGISSLHLIFTHSPDMQTAKKKNLYQIKPEFILPLACSILPEYWDLPGISNAVWTGRKSISDLRGCLDTFLYMAFIPGSFSSPSILRV